MGVAARVRFHAWKDGADTPSASQNWATVSQGVLKLVSGFCYDGGHDT